MKRVCTILVASGLLAFLGCSEKSDLGGPGARRTDNKTAVTGSPKNETFRLSAPSTETSLKQGEEKEVDITVDRSKDFKQDVTLTFKSDKGVTVTPPTTTVKANEKDTKVRVKVAAAKDAPVGEATVHVAAKPETGDTTSVEFRVNVKGA